MKFIPFMHNINNEDNNNNNKMSWTRRFLSFILRQMFVIELREKEQFNKNTLNIKENYYLITQKNISCMCTKVFKISTEFRRLKYLFPMYIIFCFLMVKHFFS